MLQQLLPFESVRSLVKIAQKLLPFLTRTPQVETLQSMREQLCIMLTQNVLSCSRFHGTRGRNFSAHEYEAVRRGELGIERQHQVRRREGLTELVLEQRSKDRCRQARVRVFVGVGLYFWCERIRGTRRRGRVMKVPLEHVELVGRVRLVVVRIARGCRTGDGDDKLGVTPCNVQQRVVSLARKGRADETAASAARARGVEGCP